MSVPDYHAQHADAIVVALTTNKDNHYGDCFLGDWKAAGLPQATKAKAFVTTVDRGTFDRKVGMLSATDFERLRDSIRMVLGL